MSGWWWRLDMRLQLLLGSGLIIINASKAVTTCLTFPSYSSYNVSHKKWFLDYATQNCCWKWMLQQYNRDGKEENKQSGTPSRLVCCSIKGILRGWPVRIWIADHQKSVLIWRSSSKLSTIERSRSWLPLASLRVHHSRSSSVSSTDSVWTLGIDTRLKDRKRNVSEAAAEAYGTSLEKWVPWHYRSSRS